MALGFSPNIDIKPFCLRHTQYQIPVILTKNILGEKPHVILFLLVLKVLFNLALNAIYKYSRFFKILLENGFEFILSKKVDPIFFLGSYAIIIKS